MSRETVINAVLGGLLVLVPLAATALDEPFIVTLVTKVAVLAMAGVGLNIALGLGGMVSFGHAAFFGLGGYAAGILAFHAQNYEPLMESPFLLEGTNQMLILWPVAMLVAAIAAVFIGVMSLRTSGIFFIMITLAFAQMIYYFAISWPAYGGEDGMSIYVRNEFPGLDMFNGLQFFGLCVALLFGSIWFASRLSNSRFGMALHGARQNDQRLQAVGIAPFSIRLTAFVISGVITGLAGALFVDLNRFVSPVMLEWTTSGQIMIFVILGGVGRLFGPVAGAALFIVMEHYLGGITDFWQLPLGILLLCVVLFAPGGLIGILAGEKRSG